MNFRDAELLSAYLDQQLDAGVAARLEKRLAVDAGLRHVLDDLRVARGLLKRTPRRKAPRSFTLRPSDARVLAPRPLVVPVLRYAGAIASILFLFAVGANSLLPSLARLRASAPLAYGMGGGMGGGGGGGEPEQPPQAFAAAPAAPAEPAPEGAPAAEVPLTQQDNGLPGALPQAKTAPPQDSTSPVERAAQAPAVPSVALLSLAAAAALAIGMSIYLDSYTRRRFRSRELEK